MNDAARDWFRRRTSHAEQWGVENLLERKSDRRISVVIPARNEEQTIGEVVRIIKQELMVAIPLVDELVVIDSMSADATSVRARAAGAEVHHVRDILAPLGVVAGKGEALWKSLFVTTGDVLVFIDADLTEWGPHFVTGLVGPLLADDRISLVKGYYDRLANFAEETAASDSPSTEGGRVTELVARPLLSRFWPDLAGLVQPLAGEWAVRRALMEQLAVPVGYGVEFATVIDTYQRFGLDAIAQVDLGRRAHRHQNVHDLGVMAAEILAVADRRLSRINVTGSLELDQPDRSSQTGWHTRDVPTRERPPALTIHIEEDE